MTDAGAKAEYRKYLLDLDTKAQEIYDRTVLTLSGGALSVSFAFVKDFIGDAPAGHPALMHVAWLLWVLSLAVALIGHYVSTLAIRQAIDRMDRGASESEVVGGTYSKALPRLNGAAGLLFLGGLLMMGWFVKMNVR